MNLGAQRHWYPLAGSVLALCGAPARAQHDWTHFAGGPMRASTALRETPSIGSPAWVRSADAQGNAITFSGQSGVVASLDRVFAVGSVTPPAQAKQHKVFAIDRRSGALSWAAPVPAPLFDSRSTPAVDAVHGTVIVASGATVTAFNMTTGAQSWQAPLTHTVVDSSPLVTNGWGAEGLGVANRCFVTEYDGFGDDGRLTCIDVDAFRAGYNEFQPGEVVWSVVIGASSGNSPALWNGRVFVTAAGDFGSGPGRVVCFDARAGETPAPLWETENPIEESFFGGVCVRERGGGAGGGADLYCASYAFFGGRESANLVKVDAITGAIAWSVPCNRTGATPVVLTDGRIALSGGIAGYGTVPTLQLFRDNGTSATLLWDSAAATWNDANFNSAMDAGEFLVLGGWSLQPLVTVAGAPRLILGALPMSGSGTAACTDLYLIDTSKLPFSPGAAQPGYLAQHFVGAGSTPAAADSNLYTIGTGGLYAFGPPPLRYDVNGNGRIDIEDLYSWEQGAGSRDVNLDGPVTGADRDALVAELRSGELEDMRAGREP